MEYAQIKETHFIILLHFKFGALINLTCVREVTKFGLDGVCHSSLKTTTHNSSANHVGTNHIILNSNLTEKPKVTHFLVSVLTA